MAGIVKGARPNPILLGLLILSLIVLACWPLTQLQTERDRNAQLEQKISELTLQNRGPQGPDGDPGRAPTTAEIAAAIDAYCSAHNSCVGPTGATGSTGSVGAPGSSGASVGSVKCNGTSITFYTTTGQPIGTVKLACIP